MALTRLSAAGLSKNPTWTYPHNYGVWLLCEDGWNWGGRWYLTSYQFESIFLLLQYEFLQILRGQYLDQERAVSAFVPGDESLGGSKCDLYSSSAKHNELCHSYFPTYLLSGFGLRTIPQCLCRPLSPKPCDEPHHVKSQESETTTSLKIISQVNLRSFRLAWGLFYERMEELEFSLQWLESGSNQSDVASNSRQFFTRTKWPSK